MLFGNEAEFDALEAGLRDAVTERVTREMINQLRAEFEAGRPRLSFRRAAFAALSSVGLGNYAAAVWNYARSHVTPEKRNREEVHISPDGSARKRLRFGTSQLNLRGKHEVGST